MPAIEEWVTFEGTRGQLNAVLSEPAGDQPPIGGVLLIHENRGATPHFVDLTSRFAARGYTTLCPDLASAEGGTAALDADAVRDVLKRTPRSHVVDDIRSGLTELARRTGGRSLGIVGFCFGGSMTWALLDVGDDRIAAAIAFYGTTPDPSDFSNSSAAVLGIYAALDERVNESRDRAERALAAAGLTHRVVTYDSADHAFFNDTGPRYHAAAATSAWQLTLEWLGTHLGGGALDGSGPGVQA
jgi:carboxymethylenebutenolidase